MEYVIFALWIIVLIADFIMSIKLRKAQKEYNRILEKQNKIILEQNSILLKILKGEAK